MQIRPGVHQAENTDELRDDLARESWKVLVLDGTWVHDRISFFRAAEKLVELDPPPTDFDLGPATLSPEDYKWDALDDSLWGGLFNLEERRIAILWTNSERMRQRSPHDFNVAVDMLGSMACTLGDARFTAGRPVELAVFLVHQV